MPITLTQALKKVSAKSDIKIFGVSVSFNLSFIVSKNSVNANVSDRLDIKKAQGNPSLSSSKTNKV